MPYFPYEHSLVLSIIVNEATSGMDERKNELTSIRDKPIRAGNTPATYTMSNLMGGVTDAAVLGLTKRYNIRYSTHKYIMFK